MIQIGARQESIHIKIFARNHQQLLIYFRKRELYHLLRYTPIFRIIAENFVKKFNLI